MLLLFHNNSVVLQESIFIFIFIFIYKHGPLKKGLSEKALWDLLKGVINKLQKQSEKAPVHEPAYVCVCVFVRTCVCLCFCVLNKQIFSSHNNFNWRIGSQNELSGSEEWFFAIPPSATTHTPASECFA